MNPNLSLVMFHIFILVPSIYFLIFKRYRTPERLFSFISCLACLCATLFIHQAIPRTTFVWELDLISGMMKSILKSDDEINLRQQCENFEFECHFNLDSSEIDKLTKDPFSKGVLNFKSSELSIGSVTVFDINTSINMDSFRELYGIIKVSNNKLHVLIDKNLSQKSQRVSSHAFSKLAAIANFVWGFVFLIIGLLHTRPIINKIWIKNDS